MHGEHKLIIRRPQTAAVEDFPHDMHPVLARLYAARNLASAGELQYTLDRLTPPARLKGMDAAIPLLVAMLEQRKHIMIIADFDADGATSCALAVRALRGFGAAQVSYLVPNRFEYGYGLTPEIVQVAARQRPDIIITVDNGISSVEGVRAARTLGIPVLVTDHHLPGANLPDADAIVNPNQPGDTFPSKHLAGVGVIFYVMLALRARLRELGWFERRQIPEPNLARLLDLVALGTVADVVPLDHSNRILVAQGLQRINQGQCCAGILALLQVAGRSPGRLVAMDLGFTVAPRLNAAGRLEDMSLGIAMLLADDTAAATGMAQRLDALNHERRAIEADMQVQALAALDVLHLGTSLPRGLCLFDASWHQGVIGILASRIKDRTHRPVICFAPATAMDGGSTGNAGAVSGATAMDGGSTGNAGAVSGATAMDGGSTGARPLGANAGAVSNTNDTELKGSARSVPGLHIRDALDAVAARHPHLLQKFGGHAMAAGLTLRRRHFEEFQAAFAAEVARHLEDADLCGRVISDGPLEAHELALELAEVLRDAGPWGQGFPPPVFDGRFEVVTSRIVGEKHLKMVLRHPQGKELDAIAFHQAAQGITPGTVLDAAYRLDVNEFRGNRSLQLIVEHLSPVSA